MKHICTTIILVGVTVFTACDQSQQAGSKAGVQRVPQNEPTREAQTPQTESAILTIKAQFARHVCGANNNCTINDIADHSLNYGQWLAARLNVDALSTLPPGDSFYIEVGPYSDGAMLSLGAISYAAADSSQRQAVITTLEKIPDGIFSDDKVIMRFTVQSDDGHLLLLFSDSFHPAVDSFFARF